MFDVQQTDLTPDHGGRHVWVRGDHLAHEAPRDGDGQVSPLYVAHDGSSLSLVYGSAAKGKWDDFWRL